MDGEEAGPCEVFAQANFVSGKRFRLDRRSHRESPEGTGDDSREDLAEAAEVAERTRAFALRAGAARAPGGLPASMPLDARAVVQWSRCALLLPPAGSHVRRSCVRLASGVRLVP